MIKLEAIVYKTKKNENQDVSPFVLISFTVQSYWLKSQFAYTQIFDYFWCWLWLWSS